MKILGVDPGATSGWCVYDSEERRVVVSGQFATHDIVSAGNELVSMAGLCRMPIAHVDLAVVERPKGYGPTRPQVVDCAYVAGRLVQKLIAARVHTGELERREVCRRLTDAMFGEVRVRNDATAWAALLALHGGDAAAKKGGPLYGVRSHGRAALAVAFAWSLPSGIQVEARQ